MTIALIALATVLALGYPIASYFVLGHLRSRDVCDLNERNREAKDRQVLLADFAAEREQHRRQLAELWQRIQAPEIAVMQHQQETGGPGEAILPLNDEESAKREDELRAAVAEIERIENEGVWP